LCALKDIQETGSIWLGPEKEGPATRLMRKSRKWWHHIKGRSSRPNSKGEARLSLGREAREPHRCEKKNDKGRPEGEGAEAGCGRGGEGEGRRPDATHPRGLVSFNF